MLISLLPWEGFTSWCVTCTIRRFAPLTTARPKIDRVFSLFLYGLYHCFYVTFYFTNPDGFVLNFKPVPFVILLIVGTLLIPIQTSTEEYIFRGYLMQGSGI
jgi:membrane protease YdiL (CAAX protease family)